MLENCNSKEELYQEVEKLIGQWLLNRQALIVHFCSFSKIDRSSQSRQDTSESLKEFCQKLLDYISTGHFEIFDQLIRESQAFDDDGVILMSSLYPQITETTKALVAFNDTIDQNADLATEQIKKDLSKIGGVLDQRFLLEDRLIQALHKSHEIEAPNLGKIINA